MSTPVTVGVVLAATVLSMQSAGAYLGTGEILLRASVLETSESGPAVALCATEQVVETSVAGQWKLLTPLGGSENLRTVCSPVTKGLQETPAEPSSDCGLRELEIGVSAYAKRESESERSLIAKVRAGETRKHCGSGNDQVSRVVAIDRELRFSEDAVSLVPIHVASTDKAGPGTSLIIRLETQWVPDWNRVQFGSVYVDAETPGALVSLDGGPAGTVPESGSLLLRLVRPGLRVVGLEYPGHARRLQFVRVRDGRTYRLAFAVEEFPGAESSTFGLEPIGPNELGFQQFRRTGDQATMIEVPEGEFLMGNVRTERSPHEHRVYLSAFLIDKLPVTWRQYLQFVADTGKPMPPHQPYWGIHADHPAVYVTRQEALNYCTWAGARLPTEAEREKAARGTDGRLYPWGEEAPTPDYAVFRRHWGEAATDPVGIRPMGASPYGALDMGGNVWEWCLDWYSDEYLESSPYRDPPGPDTGTRHVVRGGSWDSRPDVTSASCRNWGHPGYREGDFGFRCAMSAPPK